MWDFVSDVGQRGKNAQENNPTHQSTNMIRHGMAYCPLYTHISLRSGFRIWWIIETQTGSIDTVEAWGSREDIWGLFRRRIVWSREAGESLKVYSSHHVWISLPLPFHLNKVGGSSAILGVVLNVRFINHNAALWIVIYIWYFKL